MKTESSRVAAHSRGKQASSGKQAGVTVLIAVVLGLAIGSVDATLRARHPTVSSPSARAAATNSDGDAKVEVDAEAFDFHELDVSKDGSHDFKFSNKGTTPLILTRGHSSCQCTVSEIAKSEVPPGESTTVRVTWKSKHHAGPFRQSVTINTNDPKRSEVILSIKGEFSEPLHVDPEELNFGQLAANETVTREARIFSKLPDLAQRITGHKFADADHDLARFFQVEIQPLTVEEASKGYALSGVLVKVTAKPGLPQGAFRPTILLQTTLAVMPELRLQITGSMGKDISIAGSGWDDELGVLRIGAVKFGTPVRRELLLLARGANAKDIRYNIVHVEPDFLKVKLGDTEILKEGRLSRTTLSIEIPPRRSPASYMGDAHGKAGEIDIDTTSPDVHQLRIRVRFAVVEDGR